MHTNRLAGEQSPYLLQHAHNPVDWHPWGEEAFARARAEDKPVFLSVGYATCHWCHVMERESFEDERIAAQLNRDFVCIKVDREERPDIDRIYMNFVQATTGGGGWPMSVWLTAEGKPFFGGTYFPPETRYGRAGFAQVLERVAGVWREQRSRLLTASEEIVAQLAPAGAAAEPLDPGAAERAYLHFRRTYDAQYGGFGGAPKFPRPAVLQFLLRYWQERGAADALEMTLTTLRAMAQGGMHDQLGGGFHRYSVDERWLVPHFEKMLYDQAQLAVAYVEAWQASGDAQFAGWARDTLDYVLRDMTHPAGGFFSAEDADSEGHEGTFYLWDYRELAELAGEGFARRWGANPEGNFEGRNILHGGPHTTADEPARERLLARRSERVRPLLDDKILAGWNGLMISALARAAGALGEERYQAAAERAAEFLRRELYRPAGGVLLRRWRNGAAAIGGFLDDYAFAVQGLLDLYELTGSTAHLDFALRLTAQQRDLFEDPAGGFYATAAGDGLLLRLKDDYDGAEPSGNSVAALNLLRLAAITGEDEFRAAARRVIAATAAQLNSAPMALPLLLAAALLESGRRREVTLITQDCAALRAAVFAAFRPGVTLRYEAGDEPAAIICADSICSAPVRTAAELKALLDRDGDARLAG